MKYLQAFLLLGSFTMRVFFAIAFASAATTLGSVSTLVLPTALMFGVSLWYSAANKVGSTDIFGRATAWAIVAVLVAGLSVAEAAAPLPYGVKVAILAAWGFEAWPLLITALGLYCLTGGPTLETRIPPPPTGRPSAEAAEHARAHAAKPSRGPRPLSILGGRKGPGEYERRPATTSLRSAMPVGVSEAESPDGYRPTEEPDIPVAEQPEPSPEGGE